MSTLDRIQRFVHGFFFVCPRCSDMHRRAQQAESHAVAVPRQFEGAIREATRRMVIARSRHLMYRQRNRVLRKALERVEHTGRPGEAEDGCGWCIGEDDYTIAMADAGVHLDACPVGKALGRTSPLAGDPPNPGKVEP